MEWNDGDDLVQSYPLASGDFSGDNLNQDTSQNFPDYIAGIHELEEQGLVDISNFASWKVSSHKQGYGVEALRQDNAQTFWQSDGPQPHYVDIHFPKKVSIERISMYTDYLSDESYTPSKVVVFAGTGYYDLIEIATAQFDSPRGWEHVKLDKVRKDGVLKTFLVRFAVTSNHQNGKDTHIRALKVFSPVTSHKRYPIEDLDEIGMSSIAMMNQATIR